MNQANQTRRTVMLMAWASRRAEPTRTFADCLRGAWRWVKGMAADAARIMKRARKAGGVIRYSSDLTKSPIKRSLIGNRGAGTTAYTAAYHTAWIGR